MKTYFNKKSIVMFAILGVVAVLISSCKKNADFVPEEYGNANIRVVNAVQGSTDQDFYQNTTKISTTPLAYGQSSNGYLTIKAGRNNLSFTNTGTTTPTASIAALVGTNANITAFYYNDGSGSAKITGFSDDNTAPAAGKAKVRFINLAKTLTSVNVSVTGGAAIVTGLGFSPDLAAEPAYISIDPTINLEVTVLGAPGSTVINANNFQAGKNYTVWFDALSATTANARVILQN